MKYHNVPVELCQLTVFFFCSNTYFHDHYKASLVSHSDSNAAEDTGKLHVTYANNYWKNINSRQPLIRFGTAHVINSYYEGGTVGETAINSRMGTFQSKDNPSPKSKVDTNQHTQQAPNPSSRATSSSTSRTPSPRSSPRKTATPSPTATTSAPARTPLPLALSRPCRTSTLSSAAPTSRLLLLARLARLLLSVKWEWICW